MSRVQGPTGPNAGRTVAARSIAPAGRTRCLAARTVIVVGFLCTAMLGGAASQPVSVTTLLRPVLISARPAGAAAPHRLATGTATPPTTVFPIGSQIAPAPKTVPFITRPVSSHVDPVLAKVSLAGAALFLLMMIVQGFLTRPRRRGRWTL